MRDKYRGCMVGLALGDSVGYQVEFIKSLDEIRDLHGPNGVEGLPDPAIVSDDTQMSMCVAAALVASRPRIGLGYVDDGDLEKYARCLSSEFVAWYRDQLNPKLSRAPGSTCMAACQALASGRGWTVSGVQGARGSGAAMRSAPVGLWFHGDVPNIVHYGITTAQVTHASDLAQCSSVATAMLCSLALDGVPVGLWGHELMIVVGGLNDEFSALIDRATSSVGVVAPEQALSLACLGEAWDGHEAVASALYCCMSHPDDFRKAVLMAANTVGDSDTIACITGALMGARLGIGAIPPEWLGKVEHESDLIGLADQLVTR